MLAQADALHMPLADGSVQMIACSPPYWGLRDYGIPGQLGLEATPDEYIARMVAWGRECWRVLRDDGTLWLNLGDSYANPGHYKGNVGAGDKAAIARNGKETINYSKTGDGLKNKDLCGIPWRVALALQADGWYLRADIIWHKPNPMPESVTDRPTKAHEYIFLLTKSDRYYYDADAVREPHADVPHTRGNGKHNGRDDIGKGSASGWATFADGKQKPTFHNPAGRNRRSVWTVTTQPYSGAHFATWPEKLVEPMILAGTSAHGCCPVCAAPWERVVETSYSPHWKGGYIGKKIEQGEGEKISLMAGKPRLQRNDKTLGWRPTCEHAREDVVPCTVLDPFSGSGTTLRVAVRHRRRAVGLDLSREYHELARQRTAAVPVELGL